jgi:hypothetical protein
MRFAAPIFYALAGFFLAYLLRSRQKTNQCDRANAARLDYELVHSSTLHLQPVALLAASLILVSLDDNARRCRHVIAVRGHRC